MYSHQQVSYSFYGQVIQCLGGVVRKVWHPHTRVAKVPDYFNPGIGEVRRAELRNMRAKQASEFYHIPRT